MNDHTAKQDLTFCSVNGQLDAVLSVEDRGLAYGDGLFETMRLSNGSIPLIDRHLSRLQFGCQQLSIPFDKALVFSYIDSILTHVRPRRQDATGTNGILKLIYTRGIGGHGYKPPERSSAQPNIVLQLKPQLLESEFDHLGVDLYLCKAALPINPELASIKHLNRLQYVLAAQTVPIGARNHGLLMDPDGRIIETLQHNLFLLKGSTLLTPVLDKCGVAGVMRGLIMNKIVEWFESRVTVLETELTLKDLHEADEVFLCNSVRGVWHVSSFEGFSWRKGPIVTSLQNQLEAVWSGKYDIS